MILVVVLVAIHAYSKKVHEMYVSTLDKIRFLLSCSAASFLG